MTPGGVGAVFLDYTVAPNTAGAPRTAIITVADGAFTLPDVAGVAVKINLAEGTKCARSWKILTNIGADPEFPDVSPRDAKALREWETMRKAAE